MRHFQQAHALTLSLSTSKSAASINRALIEGDAALDSSLARGVGDRSLSRRIKRQTDNMGRVDGGKRDCSGLHLGVLSRAKSFKSSEELSRGLSYLCSFRVYGHVSSSVYDRSIY
jgi:hypothetical protein